MKKLIPLLLMTSCFTSCVTLFNRKNTHFCVKAEKGAQIIYHKEYTGVKIRKGIVQLNEGDAIPLLKRKKTAYIIAKRSRTNKLPVTVRKGDIEKTVFVKPVHSCMYYANFAHIYPLLSFGFLLDHNNPNRFGYPKKVYVDIGDTSGHYYSYSFPRPYTLHPAKPGYFHVDFGPPLLNVFAYQIPHLETSASPFGMFAGVGYHYAVHRFVSVEAGGASIAPIFRRHTPYYTPPPGAPPLTPYESKSGWYVNLKDNRELGKFELGYGLSFASQQGKAFYSDMKGDDSVFYRRQDYGLGACVSAYYRVFGFFETGFSFQPQFITLNNGVKFDYGYLLSFGVKFRLDMMKRRSGKL